MVLFPSLSWPSSWVIENQFSFHLAFNLQGCWTRLITKKHARILKTWTFMRKIPRGFLVNHYACSGAVPSPISAKNRVWVKLKRKHYTTLSPYSIAQCWAGTVHRKKNTQRWLIAGSPAEHLHTPVVLLTVRICKVRQRPLLSTFGVKGVVAAL